MIVRRFGARIESVEPNFDARALNEIGFRRTGAFTLDADAFHEQHEKVAVQDLTATAEGDVKDDVERELLAALLRQVESLLEESGVVLLVENEAGEDYPKTRDVTRRVVVRGENRLHFEYRVEPALRLGVYRPRGG
jgi:hypothetical protein